jgi:hypothetical protein
VQDTGVRLDQSADGTGPATAVPLDESGFAEFCVTGTHVSGDFRCAECGYGAVVHRALPPCPMCGGTVWETREPSASRLLD